MHVNDKQISWEWQNKLKTGYIGEDQVSRWPGETFVSIVLFESLKQECICVLLG